MSGYEPRREPLRPAEIPAPKDPGPADLPIEFMGSTLDPVAMPMLNVALDINCLIEGGWEEARIYDFVGKLKDLLS